MPFQPLFKDIFSKSESDAGAGALLQQLSKEYPYFSLAHFFLLQQTDANENGYAKVAAKTALHFNNTFLLQNQLHQKQEPGTAERLPSVYAPAPFIEEQHPANENTERQEEDAVAGEPAQNQEIASSLQTQFMGEPVSQEPSTQEAIATENPVLPSQPLAEAQTVIPETAEITAAAPAVNAEAEVAPPATIDERPAIKLPTLAAATPAVEGSLLFTPLYATDYFASQGIKLREEPLPNDKLGKQLKSFTDWLKTMKKVHDNKLPAGSEVMDLSVQKLAENSNKEEEVITESMAEVFLQQGKLHKAKEIYEKLSLLNPSKIAFFAAKIDQIQQK